MRMRIVLCGLCVQTLSDIYDMLQWPEIYLKMQQYLLLHIRNLFSSLLKTLGSSFHHPLYQVSAQRDLY